MKGKYYTFIAGSSVPKWLLSADFESMDRRSFIHNKKHGKIVFGLSCIVVRGDMHAMSKVMPVSYKSCESRLISINNYKNASFIVGVTCTGICTA